MGLQRVWHDRVTKQQQQQQALLRGDKDRCMDQRNLFHRTIQDRIFSAPRLCSGPCYKFQMWKALPVSVHQKMVAICPMWCMSFPFTFIAHSRGWENAVFIVGSHYSSLGSFTSEEGEKDYWGITIPQAQNCSLSLCLCPPPFSPYSDLEPYGSYTVMSLRLSSSCCLPDTDPCHLTLDCRSSFSDLKLYYH